MTRAEYEAKYGVKPSTVSAEPVMMTRSQYEAKYGVAPQVEPTKEKGGLLSTIGSVIKKFPGQELGKAIGTSIGGAAEAIRTRSMAPIEEAVAENQSNFSKIVGDVVQSVALPASLAVAPGTSITKKAAQLGGISAVTGIGQSLKDGNDIRQVAKDAFQSGLTGTVVGGTFGAVGASLKKLGEKAPEAIYNNALKIGLRIKQAGKSPAKFLIDEGIVGGLGTFRKAAEEGMKQSDEIIAKKIAKIPGGATYGEVRKAAVESLKKDLGSNLFTDAAIKEMVDSVPLASLQKKGVLSWKQINETRSELGKLVGDGRWMSSNPSEKVKATQAVYRSLASLLQKTTGTADDFARYSQWIRTKKAVDRAIDVADSKYGLGLYDRVSGGAGLVSGAFTGDDLGDKIQGAALGGLGGIALTRLFSSPAAQTKVAQFLSRIDEIPTDTAGNISKAALGQLFANIFANEPEQ